MSDIGKVNTNISAQRIYHHLSRINKELLTTQEHIATGKIGGNTSGNSGNVSAAQKVDIFV